MELTLIMQCVQKEVCVQNHTKVSYQRYSQWTRQKHKCNVCRKKFACKTFLKFRVISLNLDFFNNSQIPFRNLDIFHLSSFHLAIWIFSIFFHSISQFGLFAQLTIPSRNLDFLLLSTFVPSRNLVFFTCVNFYSISQFGFSHLAIWIF